MSEPRCDGARDCALVADLRRRVDLAQLDDSKRDELAAAKLRIIELETQLAALTTPASWLPEARFVPKHSAACADQNCDRRCMSSEAP